MKYTTAFDVNRAGHCIYKDDGNGVTLEFHVGPFSESVIAENEAKRLNDLIEQESTALYLLEKILLTAPEMDNDGVCYYCNDSNEHLKDCYYAKAKTLLKEIK